MTSKAANSQAANLDDLFGNARAEGVISAASHKAFTIPDVADQINAAMGVPAIDVKGGSELFAVEIVVDDSGSIANSGNEQAVRDGVNKVRQDLIGAKNHKSILMCVRYLNGGVVIPFTPIDDVPMLDANNYRASGGTPFYDMTVVSYGDLTAKTQEFSDRGVPVRSATLLVCDGHDEGSMRYRTPESVAPMTADFLSGEQHIVCAMGIQDKQGTDFRNIFLRMGILPQSILETDATGAAIRRGFGTFSTVATTASQGAPGFSQAQVGGFAV